MQTISLDLSSERSDKRVFKLFYGTSATSLYNETIDKFVLW